MRTKSWSEMPRPEQEKALSALVANVSDEDELRQRLQAELGVSRVSIAWGDGTMVTKSGDQVSILMPSGGMF